ncbi:MAG: hypothetical protein IKA31_02520 [Clostridia bacterium]|nr:hypothetical protein [Clostridia bacterium]
MSEYLNKRPVVLTKEQTEAKHAAQAAQQNSQTGATLSVDNKNIQLDAAQNTLVNGDVLQEAPTVLDAIASPIIPTTTTEYVVEDTNFKNDITGQTGILATEREVTETPELGMEMIFKP